MFSKKFVFHVVHGFWLSFWSHLPSELCEFCWFWRYGTVFGRFLCGGLIQIWCKTKEKFQVWIFCIFFCTRNYLKFTHAQYQNLAPRNKNVKNRTKLFALSKMFIDNYYSRIQGQSLLNQCLAQNGINFDNFRKFHQLWGAVSPSSVNIFQNSKRFEDIYV